MKRATPSVEPVDRAYTQQPVSCRLCRSRKLKCDRGRPSCFNCNSRNNKCVYEADQRELSISAAHTLTSLARPGDRHPNAHTVELDLAQRVERLEQAVFAKHNGSRGPPIKPGGNGRSRLASHDEEQHKTSQWLEGLLTADTLGGSPAGSASRAGVSTVLRDFPTYRDAAALLDRFTQTVEATYRILHRPTAWSLLRLLYHDLETNRTPSPTQLAFFLCIFAGSAYVSKERFNFESRSLQGHSQIALAELWARQAVSLVTEPPVPPSIEALQTIISLAHLCTQIEGVSGSFGTLSMFALRMAKTMNIHRLDSQPSREERRKNGADMVAVEIKRRVWWHMVASDWLFSYVGGYNEGTYLLHPGQMETLRPSNVEDANIPTGITHLAEDSYSSPISVPTSMSYFLQRIESATLVREIVDRLPPSYFASPGQGSCDEVYDTIMSLDHKYQEHIDSLPPFFQLTISDTESYQALLKEKPYLEWQRYLINLILHTQLARLHRPFLIRGSRDSKYEHSRDQCLRSAETVIEIGNRAMSDHSTGSFTYVLQHFLTAAIILAMDVCFNPDREPTPHRKQQVLRACRALEEELNAKVVPSGRSAIEDVSSGQLMVRSFQNAVQSLRNTLKKQVRQDESVGAKASLVGETVPSTDSRTRIATTHAVPAEPAFGTSDFRKLEPPRQHEDGTMKSPTSRIPSQRTENAATINEQVTRADGSSELLFIDELWDDFFTVGSTFNETDWDTFFLDAGANMN